MRRILLSLIALAPVAALCSLPLQMSISDLATEADHVLVGQVIGVDMVNGNGHLIADDRAQSGPGLTNVIRLRVEIDEILVTTAIRVPKTLLLPLDPFMHYSLGQIKSAYEGESGPRLVLLKGTNFSAIKPGVFFRPLTERDEVLRIHGAAHR